MLSLLMLHLLLPNPGIPTAAVRPEQAVYHIPYRVTATNHLLLRAKLNGQGPYNFILDTGAPALFIPTDVARKLSIQANAGKWGTVRRLEIEGGAIIENVKARIEDPFQMQSMNQMALAGTHIDGVIGYNVLAHFRIEIDLTQPTLAWTSLSWIPPSPTVMLPKEKQSIAKPAQNMKQMQDLAKMASTMFARKPQEIVLRGFVGIEIEDAAGNEEGVKVQAVLQKSPAEVGGLLAGDTIREIKRPRWMERDVVKTKESLQNLLSGIAPEERIIFYVRRGEQMVEVPVIAGTGRL
jgi:hypothetical protein